MEEAVAKEAVIVEAAAKEEAAQEQLKEQVKAKVKDAVRETPEDGPALQATLAAVDAQTTLLPSEMVATTSNPSFS